MNRPDRIKSVLEYYTGEKLPEDWRCEEVRGLYTVRNRKGKLSYRQRDFCGKAHAWGTDFRLWIENQDGRQNDLMKSTSDAVFQQKLFREYHI